MEEERSGDRWCPVCGLDFGAAAPGGCPNGWCGRADRAFSVVWALGVHAAGLRAAIRRYKFGGESRLAEAFGAMAAGFVRGNPTWFEEIDLVTGVPAYCGPGARRGWDPVGRVVEVMAADPGWDRQPAPVFASGLVVKVAETPPLTGRGWADRQELARGPLRRALRVPDPAPVEGASVLVVDDVLTDGSTLHEVARALRLAGASEVAGLVLARRPWGPGPDRR